MVVVVVDATLLVARLELMEGTAVVPIKVGTMRLPLCSLDVKRLLSAVVDFTTFASS